MALTNGGSASRYFKTMFRNGALRKPDYVALQIRNREFNCPYMRATARLKTAASALQWYIQSQAKLWNCYRWCRRLEGPFFGKSGDRWIYWTVFDYAGVSATPTRRNYSYYKPPSSATCISYTRSNRIFWRILMITHNYSPYIFLDHFRLGCWKRLDHQGPQRHFRTLSKQQQEWIPGGRKYCRSVT